MVSWAFALRGLGVDLSGSWAGDFALASSGGGVEEVSLGAGVALSADSIEELGSLTFNTVVSDFVIAGGAA